MVLTRGRRPIEHNAFNSVQITLSNSLSHRAESSIRASPERIDGRLLLTQSTMLNRPLLSDTRPEGAHGLNNSPSDKPRSWAVLPRASARIEHAPGLSPYARFVHRSIRGGAGRLGQAICGPAIRAPRNRVAYDAYTEPVDACPPLPPRSGEDRAQRADGSRDRQNVDES